LTLHTNDIDISADCESRLIDDESAIIYRCKCGSKEMMVLGVDRDDPDYCIKCGRALYADIGPIRVFEVHDESD
jgi:hypothetical protein